MYHQEYFRVLILSKVLWFCSHWKMHSIVVRKMVLSNSHIKRNIFFFKKKGVKRYTNVDGIKTNILIYSEKRSF